MRRSFALQKWRFPYGGSGSLINVRLRAWSIVKKGKKYSVRIKLSFFLTWVFISADKMDVLQKVYVIVIEQAAQG